MTANSLISLLAGLAMMGLSTAAHAGSDLDAAIEAGAKRLTADEIAERFAGKTGTFVAASGDKTVLVYYGEDNDIAGKLVGGDWFDTGYYGITNADSICVSWTKSDKGRLRCFKVLVVDDVVTKFNPDGSLAWRRANFEDGKTF